MKHRSFKKIVALGLVFALSVSTLATGVNAERGGVISGVERGDRIIDGEIIGWDLLELAPELELISVRDPMFVGGELSSGLRGIRREQGQRLITVFEEAIADLERDENGENEPAPPALSTHSGEYEANGGTGLVEGFTTFDVAECLEEEVSEERLELSIYRIVELSDFAGNLYTLVEMLPSGYMIYHNESGVFIERSATVVSPYEGHDGDLYYGGFRNYFALDTNEEELTCLVTEYIVCFSIVTENNWSEHSVEVADHLIAYTDFAILDYVATGTIYAPIRAASSARTTNTWTGVTNSGFISNQTIGQISDGGPGHCGFVALAILLGYFDYQNRTMTPRIVASDTFVTNRGTLGGLVQPAFVTSLRASGDAIGVGRHWLTTSQVRDVAWRYFQNRGISRGLTTLNQVTADVRNTVDAGHIRGHIGNDRPVILLSTESKGLPGAGGGHFVVAYSFLNEANGALSVRTHYGWGAGSGNVIVTGANWTGLLTFHVFPER
jgi:hypothetical protein